jgi:glycine/D-amino acid oxidase-like deaminating enzyme
MLLDRRTFAAGSAALLSGCATVGTRSRLTACTPFPPVDVDASRVIRTVAGLRPYRRSGFVVRAEPLGDKRLVHNYGHGGGGITLSWGSSKLATELGLQGHSGPVAVLGSGVMGLSTARLAQEAGFPVTIYTAALPPETTSNIAGGKVEVRRFATPADIAALPESLVFNCTGLGSRDLFGDTDLHPARGQLAILEPQPEVRYAFTGSPGYMFPRPDGIILGGTFELDQWDTTPVPAAIARILASHKRFFSSFRCTA